MSRVAKNPVAVPIGVDVVLSDGYITVKGGLGSLSCPLTDLVNVSVVDGQIRFEQADGSSHSHAMSGTMRALVNNMVVGVSKGFEKRLLLQGTGYRAQVQGDVLNLALGFSHPVVCKIPDGLSVSAVSQTEILVKGIDKRLVGQFSADIRAYRPPEPYKGKGVRYADEVVILKEVKKK